MYSLIKPEQYFIDFCWKFECETKGCGWGGWVGGWVKLWHPYDAKRGKNRYVTNPSKYRSKRAIHIMYSV